MIIILRHIAVVEVLWILVCLICTNMSAVVVVYMAYRHLGFEISGYLDQMASLLRILLYLSIASTPLFLSICFFNNSQGGNGWLSTLAIVGLSCILSFIVYRCTSAGVIDSAGTFFGSIISGLVFLALKM